MKLPNIPFYPAHWSNYTKGRTSPIRKFTIHHSAGWEDTLRYLWQNADRNASSTFWVGRTPGAIEQYVDTDDTQWTNGNFISNSESITVETRGDWRGYYDQVTLDNLTELMYRCLKIFPNLVLEFHMDVSSSVTLCPAELKNKGYAAACWQKAKNRIAVEQAAANPATPVNLRLDIPDKKVVLIRDANVWDMSFTSFANAKAVTALKAGTVIDVAGVYDHPLSSTDYYLSKYSWDKGFNNGISKADCIDFVEPAPVDPTPAPVDPTPVPPKEDSGAGTIPPLPVDPDGNAIEKRLSAIEAFIEKLKEWFPFLKG